MRASVRELTLRRGAVLPTPPAGERLVSANISGVPYYLVVQINGITYYLSEAV